jgi:methionyl-tRNA synthetase
VRFALNLIRLYGVLSGPYIPDAAKTILAAMNAENAAWPTDLEAALTALPAGHAFTTPDVMFAKITDERRDELEAQFAGED